MDDKIEDALIRRATGYTATEESVEYSLVEGELTATKRKVVTKEVPPEVSAIKLLAASGSCADSEPDEAALLREKERLLGELAACASKEQARYARK
jgi:hypothetical protein